MKTADLHIHTTASDGRFSPQETVTAAKKAGLSVIAITDHDTLDGLFELLRLQDPISPLESPLKIIPGIEFSTDVPNHEIHILGYQIDPQNTALTKQLKLLIDDRVARAKKMVRKLADLGYPIDYQRVETIAGQSTAIGRPHIARALIEKGYFLRIADVFHHLLQTDGPAYVPHYKMKPDVVIDLIHSSGGVAVLAHPAMVHDDSWVHKVIEYGIDGLEVYHPTHTLEATMRYIKIAEKNHLLMTGGSDFHGIPGRFPERLGIFTVETTLADLLLAKKIPDDSITL